MLYTGEAEYDTIAAIKQAVTIPVIANGDVDSPRKAREVLRRDGRRRIDDRPSGARQALDLSRDRALPCLREASFRRRHSEEIRGILLEHVRALHEVLRRNRRRAHRAQAFVVVCEGPARERGVSGRGQPRGVGGRAAALCGRLFQSPSRCGFAGARGERVGPAERLIALVHERDVAARGKGHAEFARGLVGHRHGLAERRQRPNATSCTTQFAHVVDGRDAGPHHRRARFRRARRLEVDVGFTGSSAGSTRTSQAFTVSFLGFTAG